MSSRFSTYSTLFGTPVHLHHLGETVTYKITGQDDIAWTAAVVRHEQTLDRTDDNLQFEHICTVSGAVSADGTDGPTLAQLEDFQTHSLVIDGRTYEVLDDTPPEVSGSLVTLTVGWINDLKRQKQTSVTTRRQNTGKSK